MRKNSRTYFAVAAAVVAMSGVVRAAMLYDSDGFEAAAGFAPGGLKGQAAFAQPTWKIRTTAPGALGASSVMVGSANVFAGTQGVQFTRAMGDSDTYCAPVNTPVQASAPMNTQYLNISWNMEAVSGAVQDPFFGITAFNASARLGYAGIDATTGQVQYSQTGTATPITSQTKVPLNQWNAFDLQFDYASQTETVFVNGAPAASTGFITPGQTGFTDGDISSFASSALQVGAGTVYFDNYSVNTSNVGFGTAPNMTWTNTGATGVWDVGNSQNFTSGTGPATFSNGDNVLFNDAGNGNYIVTINTNASPGSITVNNSSGDYVFTGKGGITGAGVLTKSGTGNLTLSTTNSYSGGTTVNGGTLTLASAGAFPAQTNLTVASGASVVVAQHGANPTTLVDISSLTNAGLLDVEDNALIIESTSQLGAVTSQIAQGYNGGGWNGATGITSTAAANNPGHLTALGVIANDNGSGSPLYGSGVFGSFDGAEPADGAVLVKYTYYGDADLNGVVNGSDYSRIDSGFLTHATGWYNGDFNYDGVINGSDYTLIDNAFNTQGASLAGLIAAPSASTTSQVAAVPEPAAGALTMVASMVLLKLRRRRQAHFA